MADPGFPASHTTATTTVTSSTTKVTTSIRFDPSYIKTIPGILKAVVVLINLIGFICIMVSEDNYHSRAGWFNFVSMVGFWVSGILLIMYLFHVIEKFHFIPWLKLEFGFCAAMCFFNLTSAAACAAYTSPLTGNNYEAWAAAAFFGFMAMGAYGADTFFKFKAWRAGDIAQGERTVTTSSTVTTPAY